MVGEPNNYIGSSFDDFLQEDGIFEECKTTAIEFVAAWLLENKKELPSTLDRSIFSKKIVITQYGPKEKAPGTNPGPFLLGFSRPPSIPPPLHRFALDTCSNVQLRDLNDARTLPRLLSSKTTLYASGT